MTSAANAQSTTRYTNTTDSAVGEISGAVACNVGTAFRRDFVVTNDFVVTDVNIGVLMAHNTRSEFALFLRSPSGTIATVKGTSGGTADNFNVLLDDQAAANVSTHTANDTATATTTVPPYQRSFQPTNGLNATFLGQDSLGTWTLFICDFQNNGVNGTFYQADLFLTSPPPSADLSLVKTVASSSPSSAIYTLSVTNSSSSQLSTSGVTVRDILPAGVTFASASGTGSYNSGTGIWTIGTSIAPGQTVSINLSVNITAASGTSITNVAEILTSATADPDSTPGNGVTSEDDYASNTFTVGGRLPGIAPNINSICSLAGAPGTTILDWNTQSWTPGSTTGSANVANIGTVNFNITTQGTFDAPLALTLDNTGGLGSAGLSLFQSIQYTNINEVTTTVITLPTAVPGVQFTVFDVDFAANDFADKLTVTGSYNGGLPSNATLTNGAVNFISGNAAIGDGGAGGTSNDGNVTVTFSTPVDTITLVYGNHTTAPADPDGQAISIHDFTFCRPVANLSVTKISSVLSDGVSGSNPKAIPGALVQYCILVTNAGTATATNVAATDNIPATLTYVTGSMRSGGNCASATTVEDENNTGPDDTDAVGMSISGSTLTGVAPSLAPATNMALVFNATVN
ncbi:DUF11 domain-containing protein [Sphingorhabdus arenilitoris]|uniref:DUF11 domain-containing protein n=1 Tax=Sphingorhabdus arenilitoris TaxID=1490041 RepID=A0ABV8RHJ1_9SPHN